MIIQRLAVAPVALLLAAVCAFAQYEKPKGMRGAQPAPPLAAMKLIIGVNDIVGGVAEPGWPIIVSAVLMAGEGLAKLDLPAALRVRVRDENQTETALALEAIPRPPDATPEAPRYWIAPETETRKLPPGRYDITLAPADAMGAGVRIESADLRVLTPEAQRASQAGLLRIQRSLLSQRLEEALAEAERMTAADGKDRRAWVARGDILMMQDKPDEALEAYEKALELAEAAEEHEPLALMERRKAAFFRALEKRGVDLSSRPVKKRLQMRQRPS
jgi:tetratricopeptide (TPR) repeat protein